MGIKRNRDSKSTDAPVWQRCDDGRWREVGGTRVSIRHPMMPKVNLDDIFSNDNDL